VIFIGDYIDRGTSGPKTIQMLIDFEKRLQVRPNTKVTFLCGNHDEIFKRVLEAPRVIDEPKGDPDNKTDFSHCVSSPDGSLNLRGLEDWLFSGGGRSTFKNYLPDLDPSIFDEQKRCFNHDYPGYSIEMVNGILRRLREAVPKEHKAFFNRIYDHTHLILGDYLFTHAGIHPEKTLAEQGIGPDTKKLTGEDYLNFLMLRNPFLWREDLPNCPYVVVHGHTPSEIKYETGTIADGQKDYRLCIDSDVYRPGGSLTCFMRSDDNASFMSVNLSTPDKIEEYIASNE
jgi:hypothetical protein